MTFTEYSVRVGDPSARRVLVWRTGDQDAWTDVATFAPDVSDSTIEMVVGVLNKASRPRI